MKTETAVEANELDRACALLSRELHKGLRHGFFKLEVECKVVDKGKRQLTMTVANSHRFFITEDDLNEHEPGCPRKRMK